MSRVGSLPSVGGAAAAPSVLGRLRAFLTPRPRPRAVLVAVGAAIVQFLAWLTSAGPSTGETVLLAALLCAPTLALAWHAVHPRTMFVCVSVGALAWALPSDIGPNPLVPVFLGVALYSVARHAPFSASVVALGVLCAFVLASVVLDVHQRAAAWWPQGVMDLLVQGAILLAFPVVIWALGHSRRRIQHDAERLHRLAEQLRAEQELSTQRALVAERARIAHDLHDVVAHHISAIAVVAHANAEDGVSDSGDLRAGLGSIASTADDALVDMRRLLGLLAAGEPDPELAPEASLDHLDRLAAPARAAGCRVTIRTDGPFADVPDAVRTSAYRAVQEGLTNVIKYAAPTTVTVTVRRTEAELSVEVANAAPGARPGRIGGAGLGLVGLRERARLFSGTLTTSEEPDGGWRLRTAFPLERGRTT